MNSSRRKTSATALLARMRGITVALATPQTQDSRLDKKGLERVVERTIALGASCLFPLGWCGEQPLLTDDVREQVIRLTCKVANGRVPVMVGVSEQSLPRALRWAMLARKAGADLILATPPYSYLVPQKQLVEFFRELSRRSGLPLVVYQNDEVSVRVEVDTISQLPAVPGIIGVKAFMPYPQMQTAYFRADSPGQFSVMSGNEYLFAEALLLGIRHFTMGGPGNFCLKWCVDILNAADAKDWDAVRQKQRRLIDFCDALYACADSPYSAVKYAMHLLGVCPPYMSSPLPPVTEPQGRKIKAVLTKYSDVADPPVAKK